MNFKLNKDIYYVLKGNINHDKYNKIMLSIILITWILPFNYLLVSKFNISWNTHKLKDYKNLTNKIL